MKKSIFLICDPLPFELIRDCNWGYRTDKQIKRKTGREREKERESERERDRGIGREREREIEREN